MLLSSIFQDVSSLNPTTLCCLRWLQRCLTHNGTRNQWWNSRFQNRMNPIDFLQILLILVNYLLCYSIRVVSGLSGIISWISSQCWVHGRCAQYLLLMSSLIRWFESVTTVTICALTFLPSIWFQSYLRVCGYIVWVRLIIRLLGLERFVIGNLSFRAVMLCNGLVVVS